MRIFNKDNEEISFKIKDGLIINGVFNNIEFECCTCGKIDKIKIRAIKQRGIEFTLKTELECQSCYAKSNFMKKYGVINPGQLEKTKEINRARDYTEQIKKLKQTFSNKSNEEIKQIIEKRSKTNLKRYGVESFLSLPHTWENPMKKEEVKEKHKQALLEKYGVEYIGAAKEIIEKRVKTRLENKLDIFNENNDYLLLDEYKGIRTIIKDGVQYFKYNFKCKKCNTIFQSNVLKINCPKCYPIGSRQEEEVASFIESFGFKLVRHNKEIIKPFELDIFIPEKKIAIEYDGLHWHSDSYLNDKYYHLNKTKLCQENGIKLLHIFSDEWNNKQEIVKSIIKNNLGIVDNKYYARKTTLKEITNKEANSFYEKNHIQGGISSSLNLGLYYNDELLFCLSFGKSRFNKKYKWEITRMANLANNSVVGGFSKCFKYFMNNFDGSIITYSDKRYFNGNVYSNNGFIRKDDSSPSYFYFKQDNKRYNRIQFQKHKLSGLLEEFDEDKTEKENMFQNGWEWIYDCGNCVFEFVR